MCSLEYGEGIEAKAEMEKEIATRKARESSSAGVASRQGLGAAQKGLVYPRRCQGNWILVDQQMYVIGDDHFPYSMLSARTTDLELLSWQPWAKI